MKRTCEFKCEYCNAFNSYDIDSTDVVECKACGAKVDISKVRIIEDESDTIKNKVPIPEPKTEVVEEVENTQPTTTPDVTTETSDTEESVLIGVGPIAIITVLAIIAIKTIMTLAHHMF